MLTLILLVFLATVSAQDFPDECIEGPYLSFLGCNAGSQPVGDLCIYDSCLVTTAAVVTTVAGGTDTVRRMGSERVLHVVILPRSRSSTTMRYYMPILWSADYRIHL
ncbi:unnamed protein product, partial [Mesorhabditis spiculigera]